jgi:hypothetical protein
VRVRSSEWWRGARWWSRGGGAQRAVSESGEVARKRGDTATYDIRKAAHEEAGSSVTVPLIWGRKEKKE